MPLPPSDSVTQWPPLDYAEVFDQMRKWSAWWANDLDRLQFAYGYQDPRKAEWEAKHGVVRAIGRVVQKWFVGEPRSNQSKSTKLPIPIASELCQASADLLFADPVSIVSGDDTTQARIAVLLDEEFHDTLAEGAEAAAALGGAFLRVTWDTTAFPDGPFSTVVDADGALPEFTFGRLRAVTFWTVVAREGDQVWRHIERHELDQVGNGIILHGLYEGDETTLGVLVSLLSRSETESLAANIDLNTEGTIDTKSPGLAVHYIPNQVPNRIWRHLPVGRYLGRSDLDGVEHLMDELAETMSDWMRARRVARARIALPESMLQSQGAGKGAVVNPDQEVFTPLGGLLGSKDQPLSSQIQVLQPTFDPTGYKATASALMEEIIRDAGYSPSTFGIDDGTGRSSNMTATEVEAKERRSLLTRKRKIRAWKPVLRAHVLKLLAIDNAWFNQKNDVAADLTVEFADGVQESQLSLAQSVQAIAMADAASTKVKVQMLHPEWDEEQIDAEVTLIQDEKPAMPSPLTNPFDDEGTDDGDDPADE